MKCDPTIAWHITKLSCYLTNLSKDLRARYQGHESGAPLAGCRTTSETATSSPKEGFATGGRRASAKFTPVEGGAEGQS